MKSSMLVTLLGLFLFLHSFALAQANRAPIFRFRVPVVVNYVPTQPLRFAVSAYDPDGDTLTYTWRINGRLVQASRDSSYLLNPADYQILHISLTCLFSDPWGLSDSTIWSHIGPDVYVEQTAIPRQLNLAQNYPNPFNPSTTIIYDLPFDEHTTLRVYNTLGDLLEVLVDAKQTAGIHKISWKPDLPSGTYIYRLRAGSNVQTRKMILIK